MTKKLEFYHLHGHTIYSKLDALLKPDELMKACKEFGMDIVAVTDHGRVNGWYQITKSAEKYGIKVILGCEIYLTKDKNIKSLKDIKELAQQDPTYRDTHMVLLPYTEEGLVNLQHIVSHASIYGGMNKVGTYYPRIDLQTIKQNNWGRGIIASTSCISSAVSRYVHAGMYDKAEQHINELIDIFDDIYLEVQINEVKDEFIDQELLNKFIVDYHYKTGIPLVLTQDYHYLLPEDRKPHSLWKMIGNPVDATKNKGKETIENNDSGFGGLPVHFASPEEMYEKVINHPFIPESAFHNTVLVAKKCVENIPEGRYSLLPPKRNLYPKFRDLPEGKTSTEYLTEIAFKGLEKRFKEFEIAKKPYNKDEYIKRLEYEISVIDKMGYPDYFLILWDIFNFCHQNNIPTGPGRGSAAGSLVAYALYITLVDPIEYHLLFERFLNPERVSPPDIDSDISTEKRELVFKYIGEKYGYENSAHISTIQPIKLKGGIRDIVRALGNDGNEKYTKKVADEICAIIPDKMPDQSEVTLDALLNIQHNPEEYDLGEHEEKFIRISKQFSEYMQKYPELAYYLNKIGGAVRAYSVHAAAVVISPEGPLSNWVPLQKESDTILPVTQFTKDEVEDLGLLKLDLLGLKNLNVIDKTLELIEQTEGYRPNLYTIGRNDQKVIDLFRKGNTHGVFQFGGGGITSYTVNVQPKNFQELVDITSLYRPGPMNGEIEEGSGITIIKQYELNGNEANLEKYLQQVPENLRDTLRRTRGLMVYQEQVMSIVQKMAGYSLGGADLVRRAIGSKIKPLLNAIRYEFIYGTEKAKELIPPDYVEQNMHLITKDKHKKELEKYLKSLKEKTPDKYIPGAINNGYSEKYADLMFKQILAFAGYGFNASHAVAYTDISYQTAWLKTYYPAEFFCAMLIADSSDNEKIAKHLLDAKKNGIEILPPDINQSNMQHTLIKKENGQKIIRFGLSSIKGIGEKALLPVLNERSENGPYSSFEEFMERIQGKGVNKKTIDLLILSGAFDSIHPDRNELWNIFTFDYYYQKQPKQKRLQLDELGKKPVPIDKKQIAKYEEEIIGFCLSYHPLQDLPFKPWNLISNNESVELAIKVKTLREVNTKNNDKMCFIQAELLVGEVSITCFPNVYEKYKNHIQNGESGEILIVRGKKKIEQSGKYEGKETLIANQFIYAKNYKPDEQQSMEYQMPVRASINDYMKELIEEEINENSQQPIQQTKTQKPSVRLILPKQNLMWDILN
ncbi:MAG: DNA polymerase III subunit alpha [Ignavibacterium sp.]|nr:DNA polymerase III subunit alpha [Ignavibacterium sp.]